MKTMPASKRTLLTLPLLLLLLPSAACNRGEPEIAEVRAMFGELPETMPGSEGDTPALVELGRKLYFDPILSVNRTQSCNSCHPVDGRGAGADNFATSPGAIAGRIGRRNSPTVLNAGLHIGQFWDGRAATLAEQAKGPIVNPDEMAMPSEEEVVRRLAASREYAVAFRTAFPGEPEAVTYENAASAIAAFERTLISSDRFDRYQRGDVSALHPLERDGLAAFVDAGCLTCHRGPLIGGNLYQKLGVRHAWQHGSDLGRFETTRSERDRYVFKVPSLRNVTLTGPFLHDGSIETLPEAIDLMAWHQLDKMLSSDSIEGMLRFFTATADDRVAGATQIEGSEWELEPPAVEPGSPAAAGRRFAGERYSRIAGTAGGNALSCRSCHQELGTKEAGLPWTAAGRLSDAELSARINDCLVDGMGGRPLPAGHPAMTDLRAWIGAVADAAPAAARQRPAGAQMPPSSRLPDARRGHETYRTLCLSCHGSDGAGYRATIEDDDGRYVVPPLWGEASFSASSPIFDQQMLAAYIRSNMPLGTRWNRPVLSPEEASDLAAYIRSMPRSGK